MGQTTLDWLKPLAAALFGWVLANASQYTLALQKRRQAIRRALSDLLEIRHQVFSMEVALEQIAAVVPLPASADAQIRLQMDKIVLPDPKQLSLRYDQSVTLIAAYDPILAFRLRSQDLLRPLLVQFNGLMAQDPAVSNFGQQMRNTLMPHLKQHLTRSIKSLSWRLGPITRWKVGRLVDMPNLPNGFNDVLNQIKQEAERQAKAAAGESS